MSDGIEANEHVAMFGKVVDFSKVFEFEITLINRRRHAAKDPRGKIAIEIEAHTDMAGERVLRPKEEAGVVGLALSGGGIRSAAFCLGALQAMHETKALDRVDYLSTVSGGGYIGCSLTAGLEATRGSFPFTSRLVEDETPSLQHLRDHSNYLFSNGAVDLLHNASIYGRGLVVNAVLILPFLLIGAALTLLSTAGTNNLNTANIFGIPIPNIFRFSHFVITIDLAILLIVVSIGWGVYESVKKRQRDAEIPSIAAKVVGWLVLLVFFSAFCELQPYVLAGMFEPRSDTFLTKLPDRINSITVALTPLAAIVAFLASKIGEFVKSATEFSRTRSQIAGYAAKVAIYVAAVIIPILLWVIYLDLSFWGICINASTRICSAPIWLGDLAHYLFRTTKPAALLYGLAAVLLFLLALALRPNANSLHTLYRDHLSKAFLFEPQVKLATDEELPPSRPLLSELSGLHGPYHLINAAFNIQNSKAANKRGRNADFFLFSPNFIGSKTTGYVATRDVEQVMPGLDLAAAMAVSGAAASSSMGAESIKPLTPTLAVLNIRLGYWLRNPLQVAKKGGRNLLANFYFLLEMFGLLNEKRKSVYLTDGGHIENLGLYELLKRRCRVIIAIDAEADPEMAFGSLNTLERYALIDLGVRIDLPWQQIADESRAAGTAIDEHGDAPKHNGPHCAIGEIAYPLGRKGILIYIKASLTGDENDCVFHYKKRFNGFPHETTLDQLFSEEQFEAYRALGFHAAFGFFDRRDSFAHRDPIENPEVSPEIKFLDHLFPLANRAGTAPRQASRRDPEEQVRRLVSWGTLKDPRYRLGHLEK